MVDCSIIGNTSVVVAPGLLPQQEQPEILESERHLEVVERQKQYKWGQLEGFDGLPGYIHANRHSDIPRDAQFSDETSRSFEQARLQGVENLGLSQLRTLFEAWDDFDDFKKMFTSSLGEIPKIAKTNQWMEDRVFGMQFLNGCNPCVIRRCEKLPANFPVTNDHVSGQLDRGLTLEKEMKVSFCRKSIWNYQTQDNCEQNLTQTAAPLMTQFPCSAYKPTQLLSR